MFGCSSECIKCGVIGSQYSTLIPALLGDGACITERNDDAFLTQAHRSKT
ncbi:hypothetical protein ABXV24_00570 [Vibrio owensii]